MIEQLYGLNTFVWDPNIKSHRPPTPAEKAERVRYLTSADYRHLCRGRDLLVCKLNYPREIDYYTGRQGHRLGFDHHALHAALDIFMFEILADVVKRFPDEFSDDYYDPVIAVVAGGVSCTRHASST